MDTNLTNPEPKATPLAHNIEPEIVEPPKDSSVQNPVAPEPANTAQSSNLPEQVAANIQIDKKKYQQEIKKAEAKAPTPPSKPKGGFLENKSFLKALKIILIPFGALILCFIVIVALTLTNIDTQFIKISLSGNVSNKLLSTPVANAKIFFEDTEVAITDENGNYKIEGLSPLVTQLKITADGYNDYTQEIAVTRGLLDYSVEMNFSLVSSELATLTGKFVGNIAGYEFLGDILILNEKEYRPQKDGTFKITDAEVGNASFKFRSVNFTDLDNNIEIKSGTNNLEDIILQSAGDITGEAKSWVNEDVVLSAKFAIENVLTTQVDFEDSGNFTIKDLEVGRKYKIRVTADGYKTRDYEIQIKQGENKLANFRIVENGEAIFLKVPEGVSSNKFQFFKSDFDGANETQVSSITNLVAIDYYYNSISKKIYFLDNFDKTITGVNTSSPRLSYTLNSDGTGLQRILTDTSSLGVISASFKQNKLKNFIAGRNNNTNDLIQFMNLDGTNRVDLSFPRDQEITNVIFSGNGQFVFYSLPLERQVASNLYRMNLETEEVITISTDPNIVAFDASFNGERVVFGKRNTSTGLNDLVFYNTTTSATRVLDENYDGSAYQFLNNSDNEVLYFADRNSRSNIFKFSVDQNLDSKITTLGPDDKIQRIYQQERYVFYQTNKGLYILNIDKPKNFKLVTEGVYSP
jgi:hypothetical protein